MPPFGSATTSGSGRGRGSGRGSGSGRGRGSAGGLLAFARFKRQASHGSSAIGDLYALASQPDLTLPPSDSNAASSVHVDERGAVTGGKAAHHRRESSLFSLTTTVTGSAKDLGSNVKRSLSVRSHRTTLSSGGSSFGHKSKSPSSNHDITPLRPASPVGDDEKTIVEVLKSQLPLPSAPAPAPAPVKPPPLNRKISLTARGLARGFKSTEALPQLTSPTHLSSLAQSLTIERTNSFPSMLAAPPPAPVPSSRKPSADPRPHLHSQSNFNGVARDISSSHSNGAPLQPTSSVPSSISGGPWNPNTIYTHIQETSAKRMVTVDYLRKLHDGDIFHFGIYHYSQEALYSIPSMQIHKLGRRATNYFLLGYSLPAILDTNSGSPLEYLKALSALLTEFEEYQSLSGFDASGNAMSKGRMGQMFKSGMGFGNRGAKGRRSSTAIVPDNLSIDIRQAELLGIPSAGRVSDPSSPQDLTSPINPTGHEFAYLLTPHIPFELDFNTTLGTLCETLIDVYAKLLDIIGGPENCTAAVGEAFAKADKAIRKILVANVVREFEETTRAGVKAEMAGLGKLTLGGLM